MSHTFLLSILAPPYVDMRSYYAYNACDVSLCCIFIPIFSTHFFSVNKRWKRISGDKQLWPVIEIEPKSVLNRQVLSLIKAIGSSNATTLRITSFHPNGDLSTYLP